MSSVPEVHRRRRETQNLTASRFAIKHAGFFIARHHVVPRLRAPHCCRSSRQPSDQLTMVESDKRCSSPPGGGHRNVYGHGISGLPFVVSRFPGRGLPDASCLTRSAPFRIPAFLSADNTTEACILLGQMRFASPACYLPERVGVLPTQDTEP